MGLLSRYCAVWAIFGTAGCTSLYIEPFEETGADAGTETETEELRPKALTLVVQGVGFGEFDEYFVTVRFPDIREQRVARIERGRFTVDYVVLPPKVLPPSVMIHYRIEDAMHSLCEGEGTPLFNAEVPLVAHEGFATAVIDHFEVPPEPIECEPHRWPEP